MRGDFPGRLARLLRAPANVALHGSPGSGKSWIADRSIEQLEHVGTRSVRFDLSTSMTGAEVFAELATEVSGQGVAGGSSNSTRESWKRLRAVLAAEKRLTVLALDQFDRVIHFPDSQQFLLLLRELLHRPEALHCTALITSRRSLAFIETHVSGISTLASVCYTEYLGGVNAADIGAFGETELEHDDIRSCLSWSGGHAGLTKYWLATRPDSNPSGASELERARAFVRVVDHLAELKLLSPAAQLVLGPVVSDLFLERQELEELGVLPRSPEAESDDPSLADQPVFRDALAHRTWNLDPWGIFGVAEVRVRSVIELVLADHYGDDWPDEVANKNAAVKKARNEALAKMERDSRMFGRQAPWLSYTYPLDLWAIINAEWAVFAAVFAARDKAYWRGTFTAVSEYRAPLAHGRPEVLGQDRRAHLSVLAREILDELDRFDARRNNSVLQATLGDD
ncbi:ATP-binding protein [Nocardioides sp. S5]|uniref:ATP-binding protein n=1 Tax=Nocardioides sp. S5 TaxID=2017486 RepID=UPI001A8D7F14|nr:ATP-binding protein [Nocardioides sp. S5]